MNIQKLLYNEATRQYELLLTPIHLLPIKLKGSKIEKMIQEILRELRKQRLFFRPTFYPSDEFGCVQDTTNIGIPFYMVNPEVEELNRILGSERNKILGKHELKALLRHECGHAFFYAYSIAKNKAAQKIFGEFSSKRTPLKDIDPHSIDFVDYLARWGAASQGYSQTHPEEDFADTFAAWLDPLENRNGQTGKVLKKLELVKTLVRRAMKKKPKRLSPELDKPLMAMKETVESFFQKHFGSFDLELFHQNATGFLDPHLRKAFVSHIAPKKEFLSAAQFLERNKRGLIRQAKKWGKNPTWLNHLVEKSIDRAEVLHLAVPGGNARKAKRIFSALLVLMTTLLKENGRLD